MNNNRSHRLLAACCLAGLTAALSGADEIPAIPAEQSIATILETKVICREPGRYLGDGSEYGVDTHFHPSIKKRVVEADRYMGWATLTKTRQGELIVAFSGDRDAHVCPWGKTQIIRSLDQGRTWAKPETITDTPLDDRDAGIIQTQKGTLVVSWFTSVVFNTPAYATANERYARHAETITPELRKQWLGNWTRRSEDNGKTWGTPVRTVGTAPHGPNQLRDGRLLYMGTAVFGKRSEMVFEESHDDGRSWNVLARIPNPDWLTPGWSEPHVVELKSGKLIGMIRHQPKDAESYLIQTESMDGGRTWTPLHRTGIWGYPPHLLELKNGWLLVSYGHRRAPFGQKACISRDEGKTWDLENQVSLAGSIGPDMGYPSSVELDDGSILTVFYQAEKPGQNTLLMSTHWKLKGK